MLEMVKVLYDDYLEHKRPVQGESSKKSKSKEGEDPPTSPPSPPSFPSSYSSSSTSSTSTARKHSQKHKPDMLLLKLDVKFVLPMYVGEVNDDKIDNWVRQMEVYCNVQQIKDEETKISLASFRLESTTLIWWQSKMQHVTQQVGKIFPSWHDFISTLRKQFYPLGFKEKTLIEWQSLKVRKVQSMQEYTNEFHKMDLMLDVPLTTQETLMKYIGGFPAYIHNIVFMFGPTNIDEVYVQETYIKHEKIELVYQGNHLQRKMAKEKGMGRNQI
jgi:hypothetical protein